MLYNNVADIRFSLTIRPDTIILHTHLSVGVTKRNVYVWLSRCPTVTKCDTMQTFPLFQKCFDIFRALSFPLKITLETIPQTPR